MARKKSKAKKVATALLATVVLLGAAGTLAVGAMTDWSFKSEDLLPFKDVKIEAEQTKVYTGEALVPDVQVPEGYEVSMKIMKGEEVVEEAIEIGDYNFTITVKTGEKTKDYDVILHIVEEVQTEVTNSEFITLKTLSVGTNAAGQTEKVVSYTVSGNLDPQKIVGALTWTSAEIEADISTFMTAVINKEAKTITLTCLQAFSNQMTYTIYSEELAEAKASITIDYQQKVLSEASVDISATNSAFGDGLKITTTTKAPTYSVGSILIEDKPSENLRFTYNWKAADGTQFSSILPSNSDITLGEIESIFGSSVAGLVDGVSKLKGMNFSSKSEKVEANTAKILRAINNDIRDIHIKCADRLHNMMTIGFKSEFKQRENALETIDLYVPLAYRTGMYEVKKKLEDLSFKVLHPLDYEDTSRKINEYLDINKDTLDGIVSNIEKTLRDNNIKGVVKLRIKEVYSTYKKLNKLNRKFNNSDTSIVTLDAVHDLFAVKIITDDYLDCYKAVAVINKEYVPAKSIIKDFIAVPKPNLYQSLHIVVSVNNCLVQVQIRTNFMDMIDTYGLPYYIYSKNKPFSEVQDEIRESLQFCKDLNFLSEYFERNDLYVEKVKKELFANEHVYVRTKNNRTIELPLGSTPIDLAFLEGDSTGYNLGKAIVNGIEVPLDYELKNNDRVSFVMGGGPEDYWLDSVKTTRAKEKILEFKRTCNYY